MTATIKAAEAAFIVLTTPAPTAGSQPGLCNPTLKALGVQPVEDIQERRLPFNFQRR